MKLKFENIFEAIIADPVKAKEANDRATIITAVRDLMIACEWDVKDRINVSVDKDSIVINRGGLEPKYTLFELLEKCD